MVIGKPKIVILNNLRRVAAANPKDLGMAASPPEFCHPQVA